jgi:hypothetical protein
LVEKRWLDTLAAEKSVLASVNRRMLFTSIFLTSLSGLVLEVAITRIFSAAIWYHYAFAAVSLALVGLGASGLAVQFFSSRIKDTWSENLAVCSAWAIVVFIPITLFVMHSLASQVAYLPLFMFLFAVPFFFIGIIISSAFNAFAVVAGRLYASDLIGASVGAILVVLFLIVFGGEGATLFVGVIVAISATIMSQMSKNKKKALVSV